MGPAPKLLELCPNSQVYTVILLQLFSLVLTDSRLVPLSIRKHVRRSASVTEARPFGLSSKLLFYFYKNGKILRGNKLQPSSLIKSNSRVAVYFDYPT